MDSNKKKILIIDDDRDILSLLNYTLQKKGYELMIVDSAPRAFEAARKFNPDLIILDMMMPEINGIEVCRKLRSSNEFNNTFIFFLSAKSDNNLQIAAFETGGDDYIEKMFGLRVLINKIDAVLKENYVISKRQKIVAVKEVVLDRETFSLKVGETKITLPKYEFEVVFFLAQNNKKVVSRKKILNSIWGSEIHVVPNSIDSIIDNIKTKLGKHIIEKVEKNGFLINVA